MLEFLRREKGAHPTPPLNPRIEADLRGAVVQGPVAIGEHIVQIHADHGAVVNYLAPERRPVPRLRRPPVRRFPRDFADLLGRDDVVSAVRAELGSGGSVEVHGPDGVGKTSVLRYLARRIDHDDEQGLVFAGCRRMAVDDLLQLLFESFYECDQAMVASPAQLSEYLPDARAVVLLDDVELDRQDLESVLDLALACAFIWAGIERRLWRDGRSIGLGGLDPRAALALFERELGAPLAGSDREAAEAFCRAVGEPLPIVQAADLVRRGELSAASLPATAGATEIEARLTDSLSDPERAVLAPLAAVRDAPLDAERVADASDDADAPAFLASLEHRGVVQSHSPSYTLRVEADAFEPRLEPTLSALAKWAETAADSSTIAAAAPSILAALEAGGRAGLHAEVFRLARAADPGLMGSGRWAAWQTSLRRALAAARRLEKPSAEAWALHQLGSRALPRGESELAESALQSALELRERINDSDGAEVTRHNLDVLHGGPPSSGPGKPPDGGGLPRWLLPGALATLVAAGLAAGAIALTGGDNGSSDSALDQNQVPGAENTADQNPEANGNPGGEDGTVTTPQPALLTPNPVQIGSVDVRATGSASATATNNGPVAITLGQATLPSDTGFALGTDSCSGEQLSPNGGSCEMSISFSGSDPGEVTTTLTLSDAGTGAPAGVEVVATVPEPPEEGTVEQSTTTPETTTTTQTTTSTSSGDITIK